MSQIYPSVEKNRYCKLLRIDKQKECYVYSKGKKYIDAVSCLWNKNLGYSVDNLLNILAEQIDECSNINPWISTAIVNEVYAQKIIKFTGFEGGNVFYSLSGSESIEIAIKASRKFHALNNKKDKKYIISFEKSYHGSSIAAWSISGSQKYLFDTYSPLMNGRVFVPFIENIENYYVLEKFVKKNHAKIAAVIIEPIMLYGGGYELPVEMGKLIKELCLKYDILLIFDEVSTGFYRTGKRFAYLNYGFQPDILCLSKGINNGILPFGLTIFKKKIFSKLSESDSFEHFSTQNFNPLLTKTALYTLELYRKEDYSKKVIYLSNIFNKQINKMLNNFLSRYFIKGLFIILEFKNIDTNEKILNFFSKLLSNGLITYIYNNGESQGITLVPMYIMSEEEVKTTVKIIRNTYLECVKYE